MGKYLLILLIILGCVHREYSNEDYIDESEFIEQANRNQVGVEVHTESEIKKECIPPTYKEAQRILSNNVRKPNGVGLFFLALAQGMVVATETPEQKRLRVITEMDNRRHNTNNYYIRLEQILYDLKTEYRLCLKRKRDEDIKKLIKLRKQLKEKTKKSDFYL